MDTLKITDLEDSTVEALRQVAEANGHTIEQEAAQLIRSGLAASPRLTRRQRADAIAAMTPKGVKQTDSVEIVRQMREERDRELGC